MRRSLFIVFVISLFNVISIISAQQCPVSPVVHISNNSSCPLEYYLCHNGLQSGMTLLLSSSLNHTVSNSKFCLLANLSNVTIKSESHINPAFVTCNRAWTGFGFYNTRNLTFIDLVFHQCGGEIQLSDTFTNGSNFYFGPYQRAVLLFSHCFNTHLESVSIMAYGGFGIVAVNALGSSTLNNINVTDNDPCNQIVETNGWFNFSCSGSGIVFLYIKTQFSNVSEIPLTITAQHLLLSRNFNYYKFEDNLINLIGPTYSQNALISATGLTLIMASNQHQVDGFFNDIEISHTNGTHTGGIVLIYHKISSKHLLIMSSLLITNNRNYNLAGRFSPGVSIFLTHELNTNQKLVLHQTIIITDSLFKHNIGAIGVCIYIATQLYRMFLDIENTHFIENEASVQGSCMYVEPVTANAKYFYFESLDIHLTNVLASRNGFRNQSYPYDYQKSEVSVFAFVNVHDVIVQDCNFSNNVGPALQLSGSGLKFGGHFYCENNIASMGACIFLKGFSQIALRHAFTAIFIGNEALTSGGAIYADNNDISTRLCTIQVEFGGDLNTSYNMTFINNTAYLDGDAIKIVNLYNCSVYSEYDNSIIKPSILLAKLFNVIPKQISSIASIAVELLCCNDSVHTCECQPFKFYPGQTLLIPVTAVDAAHVPVYANVFAIAYRIDNHKGSETWKIDGETINRLYANKCNKLNFTIVTMIGSQPLNGNLRLYTIENKAVKNYKLLAMPCPFGFTTVNSKCDCSSFLYNLNKDISCDIQTVTISLPYSSWFGNISPSLSNNSQSVEGFSLVCPPEYCYPFLTTYNATMLNPLCQYGRTGIICGQCNDNLSLVFGSNECQECSNLWLLSILGYAFIGLFLVLVLFVFNLTVSNGTLGGLVFFANMSAVSLHTNILVDELHTLPVKLSLSFLNLNLGYPMCFYHGMDITAKTGLQFVFPVYLWSLVLGLVVISRYSSRLSNLIVGSSVQVLATLIQLSFAKLLLTISDIFTSAKVHTTHHPLTVWYFGGNITYLSGGHLVLFLLSLLTSLLFLLPYLVITTIASHLRKYRLSKYIRPLIDAYHGPYKDRLGYWFGVRQWLVVFLYIVYACLSGIHPLIMLIIHIAIVALFMIVQNHVKPFKNTLVNLLDTWFTFLLFIMDIMTFFLISENSNLRSRSQYAFVVLLLYLISVIGVVLYHGVIAIRGPRRVILKFFGIVQKILHIRVTTRRDMEYDDDSGLREPLLDSVQNVKYN